MKLHFEKLVIGLVKLQTYQTHTKLNLGMAGLQGQQCRRDISGARRTVETAQNAS